MKYKVVDTHTNRIIAEFIAQGHAIEYIKYLNTKLNQRIRFIVVEQLCQKKDMNITYQ